MSTPSPTETAATPPAAPTASPPPDAPPAIPLRRAPLYIAAGLVLSMTQGLGQGIVTANIPQFAGDLHLTTAQASWLTAAYMIPRAVLPLLLIKIRTQFGLRRFAEIGIVAYLLVSVAAQWIDDQRSAVVVQALSGMAAAPLSTLTFLYALEALPPALKMRMGLPLVMAAFSSGPVLARVISPALVGDGGLIWVHLLTLSLAMMSFAVVFLLPLRPVPHMKVIQPVDFLSILLMAIGFGGVIIGFVMGPTYWWTSQAWIGWVMVAGVSGLAALMVLELNRAAPMIDIRWLLSPKILHLAIALFLFRLVMSEQSSGAPRLFQTLGLAPSQMTGLFAIMIGAYVVGALICMTWMNGQNLPQFHLIALLMVAGAAWTDAQATVLTRPEQLYITQAMIGVASMMFLSPAMMAGLGAALAKGPHYLLSFVIMFLTTQSVGAVIGSGGFTTLINLRQAFHMQVLSEQLLPTSATLSAEIAGRMAVMASQIPDLAARKAQAMAQVAGEVSSQAYVLAYNDVYFLTFLLAGGAAAALMLHMFRDWLAARMGHSQTGTAS